MNKSYMTRMSQETNQVDNLQQSHDHVSRAPPFQHLQNRKHAVRRYKLSLHFGWFSHDIQLFAERRRSIPDNMREHTVKLPADHKHLAVGNPVRLGWVHRWAGWRCCRGERICHVASWHRDHLLQNLRRSKVLNEKRKKGEARNCWRTSAKGSSSSESSPSCSQLSISQARW